MTTFRCSLGVGSGGNSATYVNIHDVFNNKIPFFGLDLALDFELDVPTETVSNKVKRQNTFCLC